MQSGYQFQYTLAFDQVLMRCMGFSMRDQYYVNNKTIPTTTTSNQTIDITNLKIFFIILNLQTDSDIFLSGRIFPPLLLSDTLNNHFDYGYESSDFQGKLCKCSYHFYQLAYFFIHLHFLLSSFDSYILHYNDMFVKCISLCFTFY